MLRRTQEVRLRGLKRTVQAEPECRTKVGDAYCHFFGGTHAKPQIDGSNCRTSHPSHAYSISDRLFCFGFRLGSSVLEDFKRFLGQRVALLLGIGLIMAALAAVMGLTDVLGDDQIRNLSDAWLHAGGNVVAVVIELYNWYSRYEHGTPAVVPTGLILSLVVVLILLLTGWKRWSIATALA